MQERKVLTEVGKELGGGGHNKHISQRNKKIQGAIKATTEQLRAANSEQLGKASLRRQPWR